MLSQHQRAAQKQARCSFELGAERQHCRTGRQLGHDARRVAAGTPQQRRTLRTDARYRIVERTGDSAVVHQKGVGRLAQASERVRRFDAQRLAARIATGAHQRTLTLTRQQVVQRGSWQQAAE